MKAQVLALPNKEKTFDNILTTIIGEIDIIEDIFIKNGIVFIKDCYTEESFEVGKIDPTYNALIEAGRLKIRSWKITGDIENKVNLGLTLTFKT